MTPKEKAKELVDKYSFVEIQHYTSMFEVKECALIACDEIIEEMDRVLFPNPFEQYWNEVKHEIEKL
jgi:hypothetical protein